MKTTVVNITKEKADVYIGRPSKWGNPYKVDKRLSRLGAIELYKRHVANDPAFQRAVKKELKGKKLGCFCKPLPCHGDILAAIADEADPGR